MTRETMAIKHLGASHPQHPGTPPLQIKDSTGENNLQHYRQLDINLQYNNSYAVAQQK